MGLNISRKTNFIAMSFLRNWMFGRPVSSCNQTFNIKINSLQVLAISSQPDHLLNLTLNTLNQHILFMDDREYDKLLQQIPTVLLPFGQKPNHAFVFDGLAGEFSRMEI